MPIGEIESKLNLLPETRDRMAAKGNHVTANELMQAELMYLAVLERIRNRVGNFVRQAEKQLLEEEKELSHPQGEKEMSWSKHQGILVAVITGVVTLVTAYWQFGHKLSQAETVQYSGRVIDKNNGQVVPRAKVDVEGQGVPQTYYTGSDGVFYLKLSRETEVVRIRVEAEGYAVEIKHVSLSRTGIEDIPLSRPTPARGSTVAPTPESIGFTFTYDNPTLDDVLKTVSKARAVKIDFGPGCGKSVPQTKVELHGAQLDGRDVKEVLENALSRTDVGHTVKVIKEGIRYEIVCDK